MPAGTYVIHATLAVDAAGCPPIADETVSYNASWTISAADASVPGAGAGCSVSADPSSCTLSTACNIAVSGFNVHTTSTLKYAPDGTATGTESVSDTDSSGTTIVTCGYDLTVTRS